jgi:streptogramin lyase
MKWVDLHLGIFDWFAVKENLLMSRKNLFFPILITSLLSACGGSILSANTPVDTSENECISPITTFAYPVYQRGDNQSILDQEQTQVLPFGPWQLETELPELPEGADSYAFTVLARQNKNTEIEIWVRRNWWFVGDQANEPGGSQILVHRLGTKEWQEISTHVQGTQGLVSELFLAKNGVIWANSHLPSQHLIAIYNEDKYLFELVKGSDNIPEGRLLFDQDGKFWIVNSQDGVYSFNLSSMEVKKHIDIPDLLLPSGSELTPIVISPDESMYFLSEGGKNGNELIRFFLKSGEVERNVPIGLEHPWPIYSLFVDKLGKLWIHDLGWKDLNGTWNQIIRSPVFLINRTSDSEPNFTWPYAYIVLESSDGSLWFRSENGMTRLIPEQGEWCWFTTYQSNIIEDSDNNLWMIADGKLYKLPLNS